MQIIGAVGKRKEYEQTEKKENLIFDHSNWD
jgi:hypothetical protein